MIRKTYKPSGATFKVVDEAKGICSGIVNSTGIVDAQKDNMVPGCWKRVATAAKSGTGKFPVICREHDWGRKVGKAIGIEELDTGDSRLGPELNELGGGGLLLTWQYNMDTQAGRDAFSDVKFLMNEIEFSVGFFPAENAIRYDSKGVRHISDVERLPEVSDVLVGASVGTFAASVKRYAESLPEERKARTADRLARAKAMVDAFKAEWSTAFINDLPDSAFAYIEPGGKKDQDGKTTPRKLRHFPHHGTDGKVDLPHLRNALSRAAQNEEFGSKAQSHLDAHAKAEGVGDDDGKAGEQGETKARHSHYHVHPDGTAHTHGHAHAADVAEHDGPAEKVPHQHGHPSAQDADTEPKAQLCCDDCKGADCAGCCADCCHGAGTSPGTTAGKSGGGMPGDPPGVPYLEGDEAVHNGPLMQVLDGINTLIAQEIAEGGYEEYGDIIRLCCLAQDAISWAAGESSEYGDYGIYSIWDLFAAGKEALSSKTETPEEPAVKAAPMPAWLKAAILASTETDSTSSHHPNPAEDGGDGFDRRWTEGFAGFRGLHEWMQQGAVGPAIPKDQPEGDQDDEVGPPAEWAERFTSPWRQQQ